jgi:hypothetical membrane protein
MEALKKVDEYMILGGIVGVLTILVGTLVLGTMFPGYDHSRNMISELAAVGSPVRLWANVLFFFGAVMMLGFGVGVSRIFRDHWTGRVGGALLVMATVLFALIPLFPCPPGCEDTDQRFMHELVSHTSVAIQSFGMVFIAVYGWKKGIVLRRKNILGLGWAIVAWTLAISELSINFIYVEMQGTEYCGLVQRVLVLINLLFMTMVAYYAIWKTRKR